MLRFGLTFGKGLTVSSSGPAQGQFQTTLVGLSALGLKQTIQVEGKTTAGSCADANTASFSGTGTVDMGDGTPPVPSVPFSVVVVTNADGMGSLTLRLGTTNLPAATINEGYMTIK